MANPQTNRGFVMIALDLFGAIMSADLSNAEMIVLAEVLLHSYGPSKAASVYLDPAQVEHYTGLDRRNARAAIKALVTAGVLAPAGDGSHRFVKDYESWTPGGRRFVDRLGGGLLRFARSALGRFGKGRDASTPARVHPDPPEAHASANGRVHPDPLLQVSQSPVGPFLTGVTESSWTLPPYKVRAEEEKKTGEKKTLDTHTQDSRVCADGGEIDPEGTEGVPSRKACTTRPLHDGDNGPDPGEGLPIPSTPVRSPEDAAEVREACRILIGNLDTQHLAGTLAAMSNAPDVAPLPGWRFIHAANYVLRSTVDPKKRRAWPYLLSVARNAEESDRAATNGTSGPSAPSRADAKRRQQSEGLRALAARARERLNVETTNAGD